MPVVSRKELKKEIERRREKQRREAERRKKREKAASAVFAVVFATVFLGLIAIFYRHGSFRNVFTNEIDWVGVLIGVIFSGFIAFLAALFFASRIES